MLILLPRLAFVRDTGSYKEVSGVVDSGSEPLTLHLEEDYRESISFHRWFAMRRMNAARAAVAFTTSPEWLSDPDKLALVSTGDDAAIASALAECNPSPRSNIIGPHSAFERKRLLDLCAGIGTVGAMVRYSKPLIWAHLGTVQHIRDFATRHLW